MLTPVKQGFLSDAALGIAEEQFLERIPSRFVSRGQKYYRSGAVTVADIVRSGDGFHLSLRVAGSRSWPYTVEIWLSAPDDYGYFRKLRNTCTCPMSFGCKHVVASLLHLSDAVAPPDSEPIGSKAQGALGTKDRREFAAIRRWTENVAKVVEEKASRGASAKKEPKFAASIFYSLRPKAENGCATSLRVKAFRQNKNGSLGKPSNVSVVKAIGEGLGYLSETDARIIREMAEISESSALSDPVDFSPGGSKFWKQTIRDMVEHPEIHFIWKEDPEAILTYDADRVRGVVPRWRFDESGVQHPVVGYEDTGAAFFSLDGAGDFGVDPIEKVITPVELTFPAGLTLEQWLSAPPVTPDLISAVGEHLPKALPSPREVTTAEIAGVTPVPILRLRVADVVKEDPRFWRNNYHLRYGSYSADPLDMRHVPIAEVFVEYGEHRLPLALDLAADESASEATFFADGTHYLIRLDEQAEQSALSHLDTLEFEPLGFVLCARSLSETFDHSASFLETTTSGMEERWRQFVAHGVGFLEQKGWRVEFDKSFNLRIIESTDWYADLDESSGIEWMTFDYGVEIDGARVSLLSAIASYAQGMEGLAEIEELCKAPPEATTNLWLDEMNALVRMPSQQLGTIMKSLVELFNFEPGSDGPIRLHPLRAAQVADGLDEMATGETFARLKKLGKNLREFKGLRKVAPPKTLKADLRPYQQDGLNWLQFLRTQQLGGVLADDMGLGKTVQTIASLLVEKRGKRLDRPSLIVAPTSVLSNWVSEVEKFAPSLSVLLLHGPERKALFGAIGDYDLVVTSFPLLARDAEELVEHEFHYAILDEAQVIKNPKAKVAQTAYRLKARHRLCLSGTPLENHLGELWSLFHFLMPGFLGDSDAFRKNFRRPIERDGDTIRQKALADRVRPLLLRRTKEHVLDDLPARTEIVQKIQLDRSQAELYEVIRAAMDKRVRDAVADKGLARSHIIILDALLKLRQTCCDPRLVKTEHAKRVKKSAKLEHLLALVEQLLEEGRRILIFSQFTTMLGLIETELADRGLGFSKLTGQTRKRKAQIDAFQNGEVPLFLISLKAGGTGLNLTAADTVIHYDPWWNPAVEEQATGRAHRIGQQNPVFVYKLVAEGTIEERIQELQEKKAGIARSILEPGERKGGTLTMVKADLEHLLVPIDV